MDVMPLGDYIREQRLLQGLSQEALCEGLAGETICDPVTLSRLENGRQTPSHALVNALLQRLGLPEEVYIALLTPEEIAFEELQTELRRTVSRFEQTENREERAALRKKGLALAARLEAGRDRADRVLRQTVFSCRIVLGTPEGPYPPEQRLALLLEALRVTVPRFDPERVGEGLYGVEETVLIDRVADAFQQTGQGALADAMYRRLLDYVKKRHKLLTRYKERIVQISCHYAEMLLRDGRCLKAARTAEKARHFSTTNGYYKLVPELVLLMARGYARGGKLAEGRQWYTCSYYFYESLKDKERTRRIKEEGRALFGPDFPLPDGGLGAIL